MKPYTYLLINFFTVIVCFIFSFDKRIQFHKHFGVFIKASLVVAIPFILWDIWFTYRGVWWFNPEYTMGLPFLGLPVEEWLFFICIPFSCVFTYYCFEKFFSWEWANKFNTYITYFVVIICLLILSAYYDKVYPLITGSFTLFCLMYLHFLKKAEWIGRASLTYLFLLPGFFLVNGILTGTGLEAPIVNYNSDDIMNVRIMTIPIEDSLYGYTLFILNVYVFKRFQKPS